VPVAVVFYLLYTAGLTFFVLVPLAGTPQVARALIVGALFGLIAYATYDLSNLATLRGWPVSIALVDIAWGALLTALAAGAGKAAMDWAGPA